MAKKKGKERTNLTLADVTSKQGYLFYAYCVDDTDRPANHSGDWPTMGSLYPVSIVNSHLEGMPLVHVIGFVGEAPYYNAFHPSRFQLSPAHMLTDVSGLPIPIWHN